MEETGKSGSNHVADTARLVWPNLATLLVSGSVIAGASCLAGFVTPGITPLAPLVWALVVAPPFGALVAQLTALAAGRTVPTFSVFRYLRRFGRFSLGVWAVPALCGSISLVAYRWWTTTSSPLALAPLFVGGAITVLATLGAIFAVPFGISHRDLRGVPLYLVGLHAVAKRPIPVLAVVAVAAIGVWASTSFSASVVFLMPASIALVNYAAAWTTAGALDDKHSFADREPTVPSHVNEN
jgi:hypothetical protein